MSVIFGLIVGRDCLKTTKGLNLTYKFLNRMGLTLNYDKTMYNVFLQVTIFYK